MRRLLLFSVTVSSDEIEPVRTIRWNLGLHPVLATTLISRIGCKIVWF